MRLALNKGRILAAVLAISTLFSCEKPEPIVVTAEDFHNSVDKLTEVMIHDIFSPPVASRVYVYPNIAAYEIISQGGNFTSLSNQIPGLTPVPSPKDSTINLNLSALIAHMEMGKKLIFSEDKINVYQDSLFNAWEQQNSKEFKDSKEYAQQVLDHLSEWIKKDN